MVTSPSEIAKKRRVLALLEKMKAGETLAPGEIREVKAYEASERSAKSGDDRPKLSGKVPTSARPKKRASRKKAAKKKTVKKARRRSKPPTPRAPISQADVKRLAFHHESIAQADQQAGLADPLVDVLIKFPKLMEAWGRGELLRRLKACASVLDNVHDVARELGFSKGKDVREWFDRDREAKDLWKQTRFVTKKEAMAAMVKASMDGNQRAIQIVGDRMDDDRDAEGEHPKDWHIVTCKHLEELTGKSRGTIYNWRITGGMPALGPVKAPRVDLRRFFPWFEEHITRLMTKGIKVHDPTTPLQQRKIRNEDLKYKQQIGELLERGQVIAWQIAQIKNIMNAFARIPDLVNLVFSKPREQIATVLEDFQDEVLQQLQKIPDMLHLAAPAQAKLMELYEVLTQESDGE